MSRRRAAADQAESGDEPDAEGLMARVANLCDTVTQRLLLTDPGLQGRGPRPQVPVPTYTGYDDQKSVADFLAELAAYKLAAGASDEYVLARVLPVALQASAARWWRIVAPFLSWEDFRRRFQDEFPSTWVPTSSPARTGAPNPAPGRDPGRIRPGDAGALR